MSFEVIFEADNGKTFVFGQNGGNYFGMNIGDGVDVSLGTSQGFSQVGETVENQSVGGRSIDVTGEMFGNITERKNALRAACPPLTAGRLIFQRAYYIRVYVKKAPSFSAKRGNGLFKMQFYAPFPYYRSLDEKLSYVGLITPSFRFPVNYGETHRFGTRSAERYTNVRNDGDVRVPFRLFLQSSGTCTNITVTNLKTFAFLKLNGVLNSGETIQIYRDTENVLRVELTSGDMTTDALSWVDEASALFELEPGDNPISASDDEGGAGLTARFAFSPAVAALYET